MKIIKNTEGKELRICGSSYACVLYDNTFGDDLPKDWGIVEGAINNFLKAKAAYEKANETFVFACKDLDIDPDDPEVFDKLIEENMGIAEIIIETLENTKDYFSKNYDLEITKFLQIVFILNMAQNRKDGEKETTFENWLINNDIKLFEIYEDVFEEIKNVFSSGSQE